MTKFCRNVQTTSIIYKYRSVELTGAERCASSEIRFDYRCVLAVQVHLRSSTFAQIKSPCNLSSISEKIHQPITAHAEPLFAYFIYSLGAYSQDSLFGGGITLFAKMEWTPSNFVVKPLNLPC